MARELHKILVNYFVHLEKLDEKWKDLSDEASRPLEALRNQTDQYRVVTSKEVDNAGIYQIESLREKLIYKILMGIENEMALLVDILARFNNANQDLKNRLTHLENVRSQVSLDDPTMKELINGTPLRPKLDSLLQWAIDGFNYYHDLYSRINECIKIIDYKDEETVIDLSKAFTEDHFKRIKINRILAFTQFLIKETPR